MTLTDHKDGESVFSRHAAERSGIVTGVAVREQRVAERTCPSDEVHGPRGTSHGEGGSSGRPYANVPTLGSIDLLVREAVVAVATTEPVDVDELAVLRRERDALRERVLDLERRLDAVEAVCAGRPAS